MLDLLRFLNDERKYVLALLVSMPWLSARDMVGVSPFSEASINRNLRRFESDGIAFGIPTGRTSRRQKRSGATAYGVGLAEDELGYCRNWQNSEEGLMTLLDQLHTLEVINQLLPKVMDDHVPYHYQCGSDRTPVDDGCDLTLPHHLPTGCERDGVVVFSDQAVLSGFAVVEDSPVFALAEYTVPKTAVAGTHLEEYVDAGWVRRVVLPIVRYGPHLAYKKLNSLADLYSGLDTTPEVVRLGDRMIEYPASPAGVVIVVDDVFDAVAAMRNLAPGLPALIIGSDGTRFKSMELGYQYGTVDVPHRDIDIGRPEEVAPMLANHPAFAKENVELSWRVFQTITREGPIAESELIAQLGPNNGRSVRAALRSWLDGKMVTVKDGLCDLSEAGADYWGLAYGDIASASELMARRSWFNAERLGSRCRRDMVKAIADQLRAEGLSVRLGWELEPPRDERDGWSPNATPDLWVGSKGIDVLKLHALHYADGAVNLAAELQSGGYYRTANDRLREEPYRQWFPLLVIGKSEPILEEIRVAGSDLPMAITTDAALLGRGAHPGGRAIWRYGSEVGKVDELPWRLPMPERFSDSEPEPHLPWSRSLIDSMKERLGAELSQSGLTPEFGIQELLTDMGTGQVGMVMRVRIHSDRERIGAEVAVRVRYVNSFGLADLDAGVKDSAHDSDNFVATLAVCANSELRKSMPRSLDGRLVVTAALGECAVGPHVGDDSIWRLDNRPISIDRLILQLAHAKTRQGIVSRTRKNPAGADESATVSREELFDWYGRRVLQNSWGI